MEVSAVDSLPPIEEANFIHGGSYHQGFNKGGYGFNSNMNHPNFSYVNPNNALQPPPGFNVLNGVIQELKKLNVDDLAQQIEGQNQKFSSIEQSLTTLTNATTTSLTALTKQLKILETQIGQIAANQAVVHKPGQFPSSTVVYSKEQCMSIELTYGASREVKDEPRSMNKDVRRYPPPPPLYCPQVPYPARGDFDTLRDRCLKLGEVSKDVSHLPSCDSLVSPPHHVGVPAVDEKLPMKRKDPAASPFLVPLEESILIMPYVIKELASI